MVTMVTAIANSYYFGLTLYSRSLLESTCDGIEVSYHAAGILCHILSDGSNEAVWRHCSESHGSSASFTEDGNSSSATSGNCRVYFC